MATFVNYSCLSVIKFNLDHYLWTSADKKTLPGPDI